ncbi:MAG TPA: chemotaxis response regulator protein-glutamate methylesterase [Alphaproteobacteria bacterium]|nr:chemotaxis response regulator protein-glutamate methylesterase [Alphaproteobacteria bacterium]
MAIRCLVVDDSALVRQMLTELLESDGSISVVGAAPDPLVAREKIKELNPDVLTLDIEMPRMDGLSFLEKVMTLRPMPVVVVSSLTQKGADAAVRAMELGAVDYVGKPLVDVRQGLEELRFELLHKVKAAAKARVKARDKAAAPQKPLVFDHRLSSESRLVAVGASTGGVEALQTLVTALPANGPALVVTLHMPAGFTSSFARRLNELSAMTVTEAKDGERVIPGHVYIATGNQHLSLIRSGAHYRCSVHDGDRVSGHRPSVDVLFRSVAQAAGANAAGVILTGMGQDGAQGLLEMRRAGSMTIGQDEATCLIYGMPKQAKLIGAVERELPLNRIAQELLTWSATAQTVRV